MISVSDLIKWCSDNAIGRSTTQPKGWIRGEDLFNLAIKVKDESPLNYYYSLQDNSLYAWTLDELRKELNND